MKTKVLEENVGCNIYRNLKFIYSEKATKFCEIFTSYVVPVKSKVKILQNLVAFSESMNFTNSKAVGSFQFEVCMHLNSILVNSKADFMFNLNF